MSKTIKELEYASLQIKKNLLKLCSIQSIHIGGDLSIADVMTVLWQDVINYNIFNPKDEKRDRFILSKGHASAVTCFEQAAIGCYDEKEVFDEYAKDEGKFSMHACNRKNPFVEVSTGSLGHGLPIACGIAQGLKLKGNDTSKVYVIMGDGEQSEGSIWEAAMNASFLKLNNLIGIIDYNGLQSDGSIMKMTGIPDLAEKYRSFGWCVYEINGHDIKEIRNTFDAVLKIESNQPTVIICKTIKGNGIPEMENEVKWHAGKISEEQYLDFIDILNKDYYKSHK